MTQASDSAYFDQEYSFQARQRGTLDGTGDQSWHAGQSQKKMTKSISYFQDKTLRDSRLEPVPEDSREGTLISGNKQDTANASPEKIRSFRDGSGPDMARSQTFKRVSDVNRSNDIPEERQPSAQEGSGNELARSQTLKSVNPSIMQSQLLADDDPESFSGAIRFTFSLMFSPRMRRLLPQIFWSGMSIAYWSGLAATIIVRTIPEESESD